MDRNEQIQEHFDQEAQEFDTIITKVVPYYAEMIEAVVTSIPFEKNQAISVIDLGCGTGTVAQAIQKAYPNSVLTCVDFSEEMLMLAKKKLGNTGTYIVSSFENLSFDTRYDVIVSSLALQHLEDQAAHQAFYRKIHEALYWDGVFINADVIKSTSFELQEASMKKWIEFMSQQIPFEEIHGRWLKNYFEEDRPQTLMSELNCLEKAGFQVIDVAYKYYNFAVYLGKKTP